MDTSDNITYQELANVLDLQQRAYETLLWLDNTALLEKEILDQRTADVLRETHRCMEWIERHRGQLPQRLRPQPEEAETFARLFASFFQTSFRIEQRVHDGKNYFRIVTNKDKAGGPARLKKRVVPLKVKRKRRDEAERLKFRAIQELCAGLDKSPGNVRAVSILQLDACKRDVLMWTYARELVYRARAEFHGPAAHVLWKQMDKPTRERLTVDRIWNARERIMAALVRLLILR